MQSIWKHAAVVPKVVKGGSARMGGKSFEDHEKADHDQRQYRNNFDKCEPELQFSKKLDGRQVHDQQNEQGDQSGQPLRYIRQPVLGIKPDRG